MDHSRPTTPDDAGRMLEVESEINCSDKTSMIT